MRSIKVLGTGCPKCKQTMEVVQKAIAAGNFDAQVEKVEDIMEIMKYDVMSTPALVVDEVVRIKGRVPSAEEVRELLQA